MSETVKSIAEAIEKVLQSAWRFGATFLLMGIAVHGGIYLGYISQSAFAGDISTYASISAAVGASLLLAAAIFRLVELASSIREQLIEKRENHRSGTLAYQNLRYANGASLLILWIALNEPNGRMPGLGQNMRRLRELGIIEPEDVWKGIDQGSMVRVNPTVYGHKDEILTVIRNRWKHLDLNDSVVLHRELARLLHEEAGTNW